MDEWYEKIRLRLSEGKIGFVYSFLIVLFLVYNFIWAVIEPLGLENPLYITNERFIDPVTAHIGFAILGSIIINYFIYKALKKYLERISLKPGDTNLKECWKSEEGNAERTIVNNGFLGRVLKISSKERYSIGYDVSVVASNTKRIEYIVNPQHDFVFYLKIKVKPTNDNLSVEKWIALGLNNSTPIPHGNGGDEWHFPAKTHNLQGNWIRYSVNVKDAVKKTFGLAGWKYEKLISLRIRGNVEIDSITLY